MKDYKISELVAHCKAMQKEHGVENACEYCRKLNEEVHDWCIEEIVGIPSDWEARLFFVMPSNKKG